MQSAFGETVDPEVVSEQAVSSSLPLSATVVVEKTARGQPVWIQQQQRLDELAAFINELQEENVDAQETAKRFEQLELDTAKRHEAIAHLAKQFGELEEHSKALHEREGSGAHTERKNTLAGLLRLTDTLGRAEVAACSNSCTA